MMLLHTSSLATLPGRPRVTPPLLSPNVVGLGFYSENVVDEQLGLDAVAADQAVVSVFEQIVAVLARQADAAITDAALFRLADTVFAAFARAGEDGLTAEQIRSACAAFPADVIDNRLGVLRKLGAIQPAFGKPYQREYRASFTSYVSMLFVQRMLARGGQSELHQLLTMEKIRLEGGQGQGSGVFRSCPGWARCVIDRFGWWRLGVSAVVGCGHAR